MAFKWSLVFLSTLVVAKAQEGYPRVKPSNHLGHGSDSLDDPEASSGEEIPGDADKDYPIFREVPETRFSCDEQQLPGYYADPEARCQAFHICQIGGRKDSFLCPNGTIFNQEKVVCDWWFNFDCAKAQEYYAVNEAIARAMEEADKRIADVKSSEGYSYNGPNSSQAQNGIDAVRGPAAKGARPSYASQRPAPGHSHPVASDRPALIHSAGSSVPAQDAEEPSRVYLPGQVGVYQGSASGPSGSEVDHHHGESPVNGQLAQGQQGHLVDSQAREPARTYLPGYTAPSGPRGPASGDVMNQNGSQQKEITGAIFAPVQAGQEPSRAYLPGQYR